MFFNLLNKQDYKKATIEQQKICKDYNKKMYLCYIGLFFSMILIELAIYYERLS
jgi:hypothetical protein